MIRVDLEKIGLTSVLLLILSACGGGSGGSGGDNTQVKTSSSVSVSSSSVSSSLPSSSSSSILSSAESSVSSTSSVISSSSLSSSSVISSSTSSSDQSSSSVVSSVASSTQLLGGAIQGVALNLNGDVTTWINSSAGLLDPIGITTDGENIYVADRGNDVIRKIVISTGVMTTLAGQENSPGNTDGTGSIARFDRPEGITTDGTNLYITDMNNHSIRKIVIATGAVTTLAGREGGNFGDQDGIGSEAGFFYPAGITTDGVNLYVADSYNHAVRKIVIATKSVSTLAGSMSSGSADGTGTDAEFNLLKGITIADENIYVTDTSNTTIRKIVISSGAVTTFAGIVDSSLGDEDGTGTEASFAYPTGITSDGSNLYVVDSSSNTVRKIVIATREVTTIAGTAPRFGHVDDTAEAARFDFPVSITTDGKSLYISDRDNNAIRKID